MVDASDPDEPSLSEEGSGDSSDEVDGVKAMKGAMKSGMKKPMKTSAKAKKKAKKGKKDDSSEEDSSETDGTSSWGDYEDDEMTRDKNTAAWFKEHENELNEVPFMFHNLFVCIQLYIDIENFANSMHTCTYELSIHLDACVCM